MKRYSVAQVRDRLAEALDAADAGVPVVIERRNVRYVLKAERRSPGARRARSRIEVLDPLVAEGQWRWTWGRKGLELAAPRRARRS